MKKLKYAKIFSFVLFAVILLNCFTQTVFAEETRTHVYELYQIFTGTVSSNGVLSDAKWGKNGKKPDGEPEDGRVSSGVLTELQNIAGGSDTEKLKIIKKYVDLNSSPYKGEDVKPVKNIDGTGYTYSAIESGYYLIKDKNGTQSGENSVYTLYVAKTSGESLTFEPKESIPTVTKKINDQTLTDVNSASIGKEVHYEITGTIPSRIADYATYYYKFADTLSKGLTYKNNSLKVELKNGEKREDITQYFYTQIGEYHAQNGTAIQVAIADLKAITNVMEEGRAKYTLDQNSQIIVTYTAVLNENAVIKTQNTNEVNLIYSNDPNTSGTPSVEPPTPPIEFPNPEVPVGETVKSITETYTTFLSLTKENGDGVKLSGAVFTLTGEGVKQVLVTEQIFRENASGTYYKLKDGTYTTTAPVEATTGNYESTETKYTKETVTTLKGEGQTQTNVQGTVDDNGVVTFTGLGAGTYTLTETKAPDGYNKIDPISFSITFDPVTKTFSTSQEFISYNEGDGGLHSTIVNYPGSLLPHTGGIGTTIFYVAGFILAIGSMVILIVKRRMKRENG